MKATIKVQKEVEVKILHVKANVRYWEDATVNGIEDENGDLIPCRDGDSWVPTIDIDTGVILNWEKGKTADIHYKVCDAGEYILFDKDLKEICRIEGYVPNIMSPKDEGYGDYIIMEVDEDGKIKDWKPFIDDILEEQD